MDGRASPAPAGQPCAAARAFLGIRGARNARFQCSRAVRPRSPPTAWSRPRRRWRRWPGSTCCGPAAMRWMRRSRRSRCNPSSSRKAPGSAATALCCIRKKGAPPVALNGSGRAPEAATVEWYAERQINQIATQTAHAVTVPGAIDAWCTLNQRARHQAARRIARAGRPRRRGRLSRDPAGRLGLGPQPVEIAGSGHRQSHAAGRQAARGRRPDAQPGPRRDLAQDRPRGSRSVLFRPGHAGHPRPAQGIGRPCTRKRISRRSARSGSSRSMPPIAATTSMNARPTGRVSRR